MDKRDSLMLEYNPDDFIKVSAERVKERIEELKDRIKVLEEQKKHLLEDLKIVKHPITKELIELELKEIDWNIDWNLGRLNGLNELQEAVAQHEKKLEVE